VLADHSRGRRLVLEHALTDRGYATAATGSGRKALRWVNELASPLLVSHVDVRCGQDPIARVIQRDHDAIGPARILWFGNHRTPRRAVATTGRFVCCASGLEPITKSIDHLLDQHRENRRTPDLLLSLVDLDAVLAELSVWSL
jgi:CheY-like chemotaxis protein